MSRLRWTKASPDAMPVGQGNPWRFPRPTLGDKGHGWLCPRIFYTETLGVSLGRPQWTKAMDGFVRV